MAVRNFILLSIFLHTFAAWSFPIAPSHMLRSSVPVAGPSGQYDFEGIVALDNCSGSIVQFQGQPDSDPAYVMTNGHCYEYGFINPHEYIYGRASSRSFTVLEPSGRDKGRIRATATVYATMTGTDLALYRTRETFAQIKQNFDIRPLILSPSRPVAATAIDIVSGYWRRGYSCNIDGFVHILREGQWDSIDSLRFTRECQTIGGTSGSPIIERGTRNVVGINNTGNESGGRCTDNNPCEIDESGKVTFTKGTNYGQQTFWMYSCLTANFEIDLNIAGCQLPH